jgi:TRAP-type mannitol/chloroaromatic compound transport system permease large subunit
VLAASGTITQLVPPSLVLIVLADQLGKSVGDMYLGAWGPSLFQIILFALYTFLVGIFRPDWVPAIPRSEISLNGWALWLKCLRGIAPSAVLIFVVLGTMMLGLATPTEAGAMGAVGAIILAVIHRPELGKTGRAVFLIGLVAAGVGVVIGLFAYKSPAFRLAFVVLYAVVAYLCLRAAQIEPLRALIQHAYRTTMRITAMVVFILIGSTCFSIVFQGVDGNLWIEHWLSTLPGGSWGFLLFVNLFVFFLAFFLDFFEIAFIIIPLLVPVAQKVLTPIVGADAALIWFGVILCVNMQTSFMHPPFGFALFYLRSVAPRSIKSSDIYWGALPWVGLQLVMVALVIGAPVMVTGLLSKPQTVDPATIRIIVPDQPDDETAPSGASIPPAKP